MNVLFSSVSMPIILYPVVVSAYVFNGVFVCFAKAAAHTTPNFSRLFATR